MASSKAKFVLANLTKNWDSVRPPEERTKSEVLPKFFRWYPFYCNPVHLKRGTVSPDTSVLGVHLWTRPGALSSPTKTSSSTTSGTSDNCTIFKSPNSKNLSREDLKYYYSVGPAYPITAQITQVHQNYFCTQAGQVFVQNIMKDYYVYYQSQYCYNSF